MDFASGQRSIEKNQLGVSKLKLKGPPAEAGVIRYVIAAPNLPRFDETFPC